MKIGRDFYVRLWLMKPMWDRYIFTRSLQERIWKPAWDPALRTKLVTCPTMSLCRLSLFSLILREFIGDKCLFQGVLRYLVSHFFLSPTDSSTLWSVYCSWIFFSRASTLVTLVKPLLVMRVFLCSFII